MKLSLKKTDTSTLFNKTFTNMNYVGHFKIMAVLLETRTKKWARNLKIRIFAHEGYVTSQTNRHIDLDICRGVIIIFRCQSCKTMRQSNSDRIFEMKVFSSGKEW